MRRYLNLFFISFVLLSLVMTSVFPPQTVSASPLQAPALTFSLTDVLMNDGAGPISPDEDGDGEADPGETIEYTAVITNGGADPATGVTFNDIIDMNTTLVGGSLSVSPLAVNDTFPVTVVGNVAIDSASLSTPFSVTANDFLGLNPSATILENTITTLNGGQVVMTTSGADMGKFTYNPPAGFEGTDQFTYTLTDNTNASSNVSNRQATVSITVSGMIWFINNNAAACSSNCDGRLSHPFTTLAAFNTINTGTGNNPADNDSIFLYESATPYTGGVTLRSGQKLIGQDSTVSLSAITGLTPPAGSASLPGMNTGVPATTIQNSGGDGVSAANAIPAVIRGLTLSGLVNAIDLTYSSTISAGTLEIKDNILSGSGAEGIDINKDGNFTLTLDVQNNSWSGTSTGNAFDVTKANTAAPGSVRLNFSSNTNILSAADAVFIDGHLGSSGTITITGFANNTVSGNTAGNGINIHTAIFDSNAATSAYDTVSGGSTLIGVPGNGVGARGLVLTGTSGIAGDLDFTDLDVFSTGAGLDITGAGAVNTSTGTGFRMTMASSVGTINASAGPAAVITNATINLPFASITSTNSSSTGVSLTGINDGTTASVFSAGSGSSITNATGTDFLISSNNADVTYAGTITDDVGQLVSMSSNTGGTKSFSGAISDGNDGDGSGISLTSNGGTTIRFSGGLTLSTGSNPAFTATGGAAAVEVCALNSCSSGTAVINTLSTTTGTALNVANSTIGSNGLTFRSISSNGSANGIVLNTTGTSGRLIVTGTGSVDSGGIIQNTTGDGISLYSTSNVSFDRIRVANTGGDGISGEQVHGFSLTNSTILGAGDGDEENGIIFSGATDGSPSLGVDGTVHIYDTVIDGSSNGTQWGLRVYNNQDAATLNLTLLRLTVQNNQDSGGWVFGEDAVSIDIYDGTANVLVDDSDFLNTAGMGLRANAGDSTTGESALLNFTAQNNTFNNNHALPSAMSLTTSGDATGRYKATGNTITGPTASGMGSMGIDLDAAISSTLEAIVSNNTMDVTYGTGLEFIVNENAIGRLQAANNTINLDPGNINPATQQGMNFQARALVSGQNGQEHLTLTNNTITGITSSTFGFQGINFQSGSSTAITHSNLLCANVSGNSVSGSGTYAYSARQRVNTTFQFQGLTSTPVTNEVSVQNFIQSNNSAGTIAGNTTVAAASGTTIVNYTAAVCQTPNSPSLPLAMFDNNLTVALVQTDAAVQAGGSDSTGTLAVSPTTLGASNQVLVRTPRESLVLAAASGKPQFRPLPVPAQSGETIGPITIGTLPVGKGVTIKFRVTVNNPATVGATRILNQGTLSGSNFSNVSTTDPSPNGDAACTGTGPQTCTPIDRSDTSLQSVNRSGSSPTNASSVSWLVTFDAGITGLTISNFTLVNTGLGGSPTLTGVAPVGATPATQWTVTASTGTGQGTLGLNMTNDTGLSHDVTNLPVTGQVYTVDKIAPTTTSFARQIPSAALTNSDTLVFRVTFSESIGGAGGLIGADDFAITGSTGAVTSIAFVSTGVYDVQVSGGDLAGFNGVVGLNFSAGMVIRDLAGNDVANTEPATDETYTIDNAAPGVTFSSATSNSTNTNPIPVTVQFSENVTGFAATDIVTGNATVGNFIAVDGDTYTFDLTPGGQGLVTADIASGVATDAIGNSNTAAAQFSRTFDSDAPSVTITSATPDPANTSPIAVLVQFSENVTGFAAADVTAGNATVGNFNAVDGDTYTFDLTPGGQGLVTVDITSGVAQDSAGNGNSAASQFSRTFDSNVPTIAMSSAASDPTNVSPILVTAQFSENVSGFAASDITSVNATVSNFNAVDGDTYTFALTPLGDGLVTADIPAGVATDGTNLNSAASQFSRTFDSNGPTATITSVASNPTNASPIPVTVQFSEAVTGFTVSDITPGNATAGNFIAVDGDTYTFDLTPLVDGSVTADILAGVAQDGSGNGNSSASQFSRMYDTVAPSVTINKAAGQADPTSASSINFTVVFSEPVSGFATADVDLSASTTSGTLIGTVSGGPTTYTVAVSGMTGDGMVIASIATGAATDGANLNAASTSSDNSILYATNMTERIISGNVGVSGAVLSYMDGTPKTAVSQSSGNYSFPVSFNWTGTVTPAHTCYTFGPVDRSYNQVFTNQADQDYAATFNTASGCSDVDVSIGGAYQGQFVVPPQGSTLASFTGVNNGPVKVESPNGLPFLGAGQVVYNVNGTGVSFSEMMGLPDGQLDTTYWLPWYNNVDLDTQLRVANVSSSTATVHVFIGGVEMTGSPFTLAPGASMRKSFAGIDKGPVKIESNVNIVAGERVIYKVNGLPTSYFEMLALPQSQLDTTYWLPWYNNAALDTQIRVGNASSSTATVHVSIAGAEMAGSPFTLLAGQSRRVSFAGIDKGPVKIESNVNIVAAQRTIYKVNGSPTSFSETMGMPESQLGTTYWLPSYNNVDLDTQLRFANASNSTATVHVYVGGVEMSGSPFTLLPGQGIRVSFPGVNNGPVKIESNANIVATARTIYKQNGTPTSYSEWMGLPDSLLDAIYWLPWYNNVDLNTELRFVVP